MTSFQSALVHCVTLAQSSWEKAADAVAEAEKAECWEGEGQESRLLSNSTCLPGALGSRALFKGFKQEEWANQCLENTAYPKATGFPFCALSPRRW